MRGGAAARARSERNCAAVAAERRALWVGKELPLLDRGFNVSRWHWGAASLTGICCFAGCGAAWP